MDAVTLSHKELPESFDGYKILQISDLIEKTFGSEQNVLINLIRKQEYDVVLFTGDYIEDDSDNLKPLEELLKGMPKGKEMYYIRGDKDENNSITPLVAGNRFITEIFDGNPSQELIDAKKAFDEEYNTTSDPFAIEVSHRPTDIYVEEDFVHDYRARILEETDKEWIDWDLSINGHTRGGQIYLPFIGPLFAPSYDFFPGKVNVAGVNTVNGHTQYVTPGLGLSGPAFARFRLFNTPSVGLITLRGE